MEKTRQCLTRGRLEGTTIFSRTVTFRKPIVWFFRPGKNLSEDFGIFFFENFFSKRKQKLIWIKQEESDVGWKLQTDLRHPHHFHCWRSVLLLAPAKEPLRVYSHKKCQLRKLVVIATNKFFAKNWKLMQIHLTRPIIVYITWNSSFTVNLNWQFPKFIAYYN